MKSEQSKLKAYSEYIRLRLSSSYRNQYYKDRIQIIKRKCQEKHQNNSLT